jgi:hypothetical protein
VIALLAASTLGLQEAPETPEATMPEATEPTESHRWLEQLVGEWDMKAEASMGPGTEPMTMVSTESVRAIGDLWILAEGKASFAGRPFTSLLTLGYDPAQKAFVGTWVDTMHAYLWVYRGELDPARKVLSLIAEGPSFDDPAKKATYRDAIEIVDPSTKVLTSSVKGADGTWTEFMRAEYRRKAGR